MDGVHIQRGALDAGAGQGGHDLLGRLAEGDRLLRPVEPARRAREHAGAGVGAGPGRRAAGVLLRRPRGQPAERDGDLPLALRQCGQPRRRRRRHVRARVLGPEQRQGTMVERRGRAVPGVHHGDRVVRGERAGRLLDRPGEGAGGRRPRPHSVRAEAAGRHDRDNRALDGRIRRRVDRGEARRPARHGAADLPPPGDARRRRVRTVEPGHHGVRRRLPGALRRERREHPRAADAGDRDALARGVDRRGQAQGAAHRGEGLPRRRNHDREHEAHDQARVRDLPRLATPEHHARQVAPARADDGDEPRALRDGRGIHAPLLRVQAQEEDPGHGRIGEQRAHRHVRDCRLRGVHASARGRRRRRQHRVRRKGLLHAGAGLGRGRHAARVHSDHPGQHRQRPGRLQSRTPGRARRRRHDRGALGDLRRPGAVLARCGPGRRLVGAAHQRPRDPKRADRPGLPAPRRQAARGHGLGAGRRSHAGQAQGDAPLEGANASRQADRRREHDPGRCDARDRRTDLFRADLSAARRRRARDGARGARHRGVRRTRLREPLDAARARGARQRGEREVREERRRHEPGRLPRADHARRGSRRRRLAREAGPGRDRLERGPGGHIEVAVQQHRLGAAPGDAGSGGRRARALDWQADLHVQPGRDAAGDHARRLRDFRHGRLHRLRPGIGDGAPRLARRARRRGPRGPARQNARDLYPGARRQRHADPGREGRRHLRAGRRSREAQRDGGLQRVG